MLIEGNTIDEVMYQVFDKLITEGEELNPTSGRSFMELIGTSIRLKNPRARLSRSETRGKSISTIGEFLWHMSGKGEKAFISYYISEYSSFDENLIGAYGPRLFNMYNKYNQVDSVIKLLRKNTATKNAVLQIFDPEDLANNSRGTCTLSLQFIIRNEKLTLITTMRSNDAYLGLPHDIYSFTMLQELIASELGYDVGEYIHNVGSLHLYKDKLKLAKIYINEGIQATKAMPKMPVETAMERVAWLRKVEEGIRNEKIKEINESCDVEDYWKDLANLLLAFSVRKQPDACVSIYDKFHSQFYKPYIMDIINKIS